MLHISLKYFIRIILNTEYQKIVSKDFVHICKGFNSPLHLIKVKLSKTKEL